MAWVAGSIVNIKLDTVGAFVYKPGLFWWAASTVAAAFIGLGSAAGAEYVLGVPMPKKATAEGSNRYWVPGSLKDAVKFFKKRYKRSPHVFQDAIEHPKAKVIHIESRDSSTAWSGINVSQYGGKVYVFVVPRDGRGSKGTESEERASE